MKKKTERITFAVTYAPQLPSVSQIANRHWRALTMIEDFKEIYPKPPMVAYKQPSNLKKLLCRAKVPPTTGRSVMRQCNSEGTRKCRGNLCNVCPFIQEGNETKSTNSTQSVRLTRKVDCNSKSVIYCINCKVCSQQYIGQTGRRLKDRVKEHIGYIKQNREATGEHFNRPGHSLADMQVQVIEVEPSNSTVRRETREAMWIQKFRAKINRKT